MTLRCARPNVNAPGALPLPNAQHTYKSLARQKVVTLSGDGGIAMLLGELVTLRQRPSEPGAVLGSAFAYDGPAVVEVLTERQEPAIPPKITAAQAQGFTLWTTRSVLSGRGDELIEVAKENLRELALD